MGCNCCRHGNKISLPISLLRDPLERLAYCCRHGNELSLQYHFSEILSSASPFVSGTNLLTKIVAAKHTIANMPKTARVPNAWRRMGKPIPTIVLKRN
mmetsp:Transcript_7989/g.19734  ORF Transcript_7989/g.19734 Transcript_7989/m.19734 type:complete len:98 (+) Transcript_7989:561-854(+)